MIINEKNTALHLLEGSARMNVAIDLSAKDAMVARQFLREVFPSLRPLFREQVQYVADPLVDAHLNARHELLDLFAEEPVAQNGTFIYPVGDLGIQTSFYQLSAAPCGRRGREIYCTIISFINADNRTQPLLCFMVRLSSRYYWAFDEARLAKFGMSVLDIVEGMIGLVLFAKFCARDRRMILPGEQIMHVNESYVNEAKRPVEIVASRWFTAMAARE